MGAGMASASQSLRHQRKTSHRQALVGHPQLFWPDGFQTSVWPDSGGFPTSGQIVVVIAVAVAVAVAVFVVIVIMITFIIIIVFAIVIKHPPTP